MAFQVSPGVNVSEIDLTTIVPAVSTTAGAIAGVFRWGPIGQLVLVDSQTTLANRFGKPTNFNAETFYTAYNFLAYGNQLYVSRAANTTTTSSQGTITAVACNGSYTSGTANLTFNITNQDYYNTTLNNGTFATANASVFYAAKWPGALGNSLKVSTIDTVTAYSSNVSNVATTVFVLGTNTATFTFDDTGFVRANSAWQALTAGDYVKVGNSTVGFQTLQLSSKGSQPSTNSMTFSFYSNYTLSTIVSMSGNVNRTWEYSGSVFAAPGTSAYTSSFGNTAAVDEVHVVVTDTLGAFTGVPGTVLEVFQNLSRATDAKTVDGASSYYANFINQNSQYVWFTNHRSGASYANTANNIASTTNTLPATISFAGGQDGFDESNTATYASAVTTAWDYFASAENVDVSLLLMGKAPDGAPGQLAQYVIDNIATKRLDCVAFVSPHRAAVVSNVGNEVSSIQTFAQTNLNRSTSYAVLDSGYKYQYDKYNDIYRYIPLNGDIAGLCVVTDTTRDPWWSPAGFNRGQIKNIVKLAFNPNKTARDVIYPIGVNPVVTFPGQGTVLYGDKTLQSKPSAFDRINVRRLFIVLEKAISTAAKFTLFEFNDAFTRAQFVSIVTPFLKDVQGRRGIYDFQVVCDETNNTGQVIDSNQFVGDIYVKPARSINYIQLNFVAVRTGVSFSEVVGKF